MYLSYYSMRQEPFTNNPSPALFFDSPIHVAAWQVLQSSLESEEAFFLLTGDYGTGKTLLCLKALELLKSKASSMWLHLATPIGGYEELLRRIAEALGLDAVSEYDEDEKDCLQRRIEQYFEAHQEVTLTVLMDEAQEYDTDLLNRLRLLTNPGAGGRIRIRIFLFAHTAFVQRLASPVLEALGQRIKRRYHLTGFDLDETKEYIYFRLLESGAKGTPFFTDEAVERLWKLSHGVPRSINNICDIALSIGMSRGLQSINIPEVEDAVVYLGLSETPKDHLESSTSRMDEGPGKREGGMHEVEQAPLGDWQGESPNSDKAEEAPDASDSAVRRHYVVVEEDPFSVPSRSEGEGTISAEFPSYIRDNNKWRSGRRWGRRLLFLFLLIVILAALLTNEFPNLMEWVDQKIY